MNPIIRRRLPATATCLIALTLFLASAAPPALRLSYYWDEVANLPTYRGGPVELTRQAFVHAKPLRPPLFGIMQHYWMRLFGESEAALRGLSLLLTGACIPLLYVLLADAAGIHAARIGAILFATSPAVVLWGRFANWAPLMMLLMLLCQFTMSRTETDRRYGIAYGLSMTLALYTSYYAFALVGIHGLHAVFFNPRSRRLVLTALGVSVGLFLPWMPAMVLHQDLAINYHNLPSALGWLKSGAYALYSFNLGDTLFPWRFVQTIPFAAGAPLLLAAACRSLSPGSLLLWAGPPFLVLLIGLGTRSLDSYRAYPFAVCFLVLLASGAAEMARRRWAALIVLLLMAPAWMISNANAFAGRDYLKIGMLEPWRQIHSDLLTRARPDDLVLHDSGVFAHYVAAHPLRARVRWVQEFEPAEISSSGRIFFLKGFNSHWPKSNRAFEAALTALEQNTRLVEKRVLLRDPDWMAKARWASSWPFQEEKLVLYEFEAPSR